MYLVILISCTVAIIIHVLGLTLTFYCSIVYSFKLAKWYKIVHSNEVEILHTKSSMTILIVVSLLLIAFNSRTDDNNRAIPFFLV